jgi:hypothetical protein
VHRVRLLIDQPGISNESWTTFPHGADGNSPMLDLRCVHGEEGRSCIEEIQRASLQCSADHNGIDSEPIYPPALHSPKNAMPTWALFASRAGGRVAEFGGLSLIAMERQSTGPVAGLDQASPQPQRPSLSEKGTGMEESTPMGMANLIVPPDECGMVVDL